MVATKVTINTEPTCGPVRMSSGRTGPSRYSLVERQCFLPLPGFDLPGFDLPGLALSSSALLGFDG